MRKCWFGLIWLVFCCCCLSIALKHNYRTQKRVDYRFVCLLLISPEKYTARQVIKLFLFFSCVCPIEWECVCVLWRFKPRAMSLLNFNDDDNYLYIALPSTEAYKHQNTITATATTMEKIEHKRFKCPIFHSFIHSMDCVLNCCWLCRCLFFCIVTSLVGIV